MHGATRCGAKTRRGQRGVERKRAGEQLVSHRLFAERGDAECMAGLRAVELLPVGAMAITGTATSPPKPRNSAVDFGH